VVSKRTCAEIIRRLLDLTVGLGEPLGGTAEIGTAGGKSPQSKLRDDDAGFFALEFLGAGELAAKEFDKFAGARAAVGTEDTHAEEKDEELEDFRVLGRVKRCRGGLLLDFVDEIGESVVELARHLSGGGVFVDDAGAESLVGLSESQESGKDVRIGGSRLGGREFGDGESDGRKELAAKLDGVRGDADVEKGSVGGEGARMLLLITMRGDEVAAARGAIDGDFALCATADGADLFRFGRTEAARLAFVADWTKHERSPG